MRLVNLAGATVWAGWAQAGRSNIVVGHLPKGNYMLITKAGPTRIKNQ
jgi:hypothetical protein